MIVVPGLVAAIVAAVVGPIWLAGLLFMGTLMIGLAEFLLRAETWREDWREVDRFDSIEDDRRDAESRWP